MAQTLPPERFGDLRTFLVGRGYSFETRPHQVFLARGRDAVVSLYESGKVVLGGSSPSEISTIANYVEELGGSPATQPKSNVEAEPTAGFHETRVGMDEAGKGDYFGPLVACAVLATEHQARELIRIGARDSKLVRNAQIRELANQIRSEILVRGQWRVVKVPPIRYNILIERMGNLNRLLGWAHARTLEDVLRFPEPCSLAIADQFGDPKFIEDALFSKGRKIRLVQIPRGERDVVVAAASVLARDEFLASMEAMSEEYHEGFPLGSSHVEDFGRQLVEEKGEEVLLQTAKVHFSITSRIVHDPDMLNRAISREVRTSQLNDHE